jgi:hypothetical protein
MTGLHAGEQHTWLFKKSGSMWVNYDVIMQAWTYGPEVAEAGKGMKGWDVITVGAEGKVEKLYALIEGMNTHGW